MSRHNESLDTNPLLHGLTIDMDREEWWRRLSFDPFRGENLRALPSVRADILLDRFEETYVPTQKTAEIAYQIHRLLVGGLAARHPHLDEQKRLLYELAGYVDDGRMRFPCISQFTRGVVLKGVTKQGKTRLHSRILAQYPQVIRRARDERAGWAQLDQLVYLVIPMPTDASKSGFLRQALSELDRVLGTNYSQSARLRGATIDALLVELLAKLALHRCGLLIIEEAQEGNELAKRQFGQDFETFFLRLLNSGIPTVFVGNPLAFADLETSSQLASRLGDSVDTHLRPSASASSSEWMKDFVPGLWGRNLLPEPDEPIDSLEDVLWKATGGFAYYLSVLRREATRAALYRNSPRIEPKDLEAAVRTPVMQVGRKIADSYWSGARGGEVDFADMPGVPSLAVAERRGHGKGARRRA